MLLEVNDILVDLAVKHSFTLLKPLILEIYSHKTNTFLNIYTLKRGANISILKLNIYNFEIKIISFNIEFI